MAWVVWSRNTATLLLGLSGGVRLLACPFFSLLLAGHRLVLGPVQWSSAKALVSQAGMQSCH